MVFDLKIFFILFQRDYSGKFLKWFTAFFILVLIYVPSVWGQPSPLMVSGSQIVTNSGCTLILKGVDVDGLEFSPSGYASSWPGSLLSVAQMAVTGWHSNIIRLPLRQDAWFGCGGANQAAYQTLVNSIVTFCSNNNAYVILDLHWSGTYGGTTPTDPTGCTGANGWGTATGQQDMPDANAITFWSSVATAYGNNPAVLFDLYNEPHSVSWAVWQNGGATGGTPSWTPGLQGLLTTVRSGGATNVCLAGGLNWCQDFSQVNSYALAGGGVVYSAHFYGNQVGNTIAGWAARVSPATLVGPIFLGEMAPNTSCNTDSPAYDANLFAWIGSPAIAGGTAWSMTTNACPNLYTGTYVTNAWGAAVTNWLSTPVPPCSTPTFTPTPTPTYTSTPCIIFGNTCTPTYTPTSTDTPTPTATPSNLYTTFPNPWPDKQSPGDIIKFYYQNDQAEDQVQLKIFTLSFRKIYEDDTLPTSQGLQEPPWALNVTNLNLANGLYYFVIVWKSGGQQSQKVMKVLVQR